ncbi:hypothetical protein NN561_006712 [Cricetulus griseus]
MPLRWADLGGGRPCSAAGGGVLGPLQAPPGEAGRVQGSHRRSQNRRSRREGAARRRARAQVPPLGSPRLRRRGVPMRLRGWSPVVRAEPRLPRAVPLRRLLPAPPCARGFPREGAAATCCGAPSERRLVARRCSPAGRTFVSTRRLLSPPSVNHSWSPGEEGRPGDARPFKGAARLFPAPAPGPLQDSGSRRHSRTLGRKRTCGALRFTVVLL